MQIARRVLAKSVRSNAPRRLFSTREPSTEAEFPQLKYQTNLFINGDFVPSRSGKTFETFNPGSGAWLANVAEAQQVDVDDAVKSAHEAFQSGPWRRMAPRERGALMYKLADLIERNVTELAQIEAINNGKTFNQSSTVDAPACAAIFRYYAGWADKIVGQTIPIGEAFNCATHHEAVGVCGLIIPWNLPLIGVAAKIGPALACGNTVVLKSAEQTPLSALKLAELVQEAGFPPGVVNIISGDGPTAGESLVLHPLVDKISFTGSTPVGKQIQRLASQTLKRVTLELGGKNPVIVCADADLDAVAPIVHNGLFWNDGEACAAGSRIFVHDSVYDEFAQRQADLAKARVVGHPFHKDSQQGAQVSTEQFDKIMDYIKEAKQDGAVLLAGGHRVGTRGNYIAPTVFRDCADNMRTFREEVFGPVMTLTRFSTIDEVVRRANATPYGLAAGVFTKDNATGNALVRQIRAGMVFWNCYHVVDLSAPFGGMKQSGMGREGGTYGLLPYLEVKMVAQKI